MELKVAYVPKNENLSRIYNRITHVFMQFKKLETLWFRGRNENARFDAKIRLEKMIATIRCIRAKVNLLEFDRYKFTMMESGIKITYCSLISANVSYESLRKTLTNCLASLNPYANSPFVASMRMRASLLLAVKSLNGTPDVALQNFVNVLNIWKTVPRDVAQNHYEMMFYDSPNVRDEYTKLYMPSLVNILNLLDAAKSLDFFAYIHQYLMEVKATTCEDHWIVQVAKCTVRMTQLGGFEHVKFYLSALTNITNHRMTSHVAYAHLSKAWVNYALSLVKVGLIPDCVTHKNVKCDLIPIAGGCDVSDKPPETFREYKELLEFGHGWIVKCRENLDGSQLVKSSETIGDFSRLYKIFILEDSYRVNWKSQLLDSLDVCYSVLECMLPEQSEFNRPAICTHLAEYYFNVALNKSELFKKHVKHTTYEDVVYPDPIDFETAHHQIDDINKHVTLCIEYDLKFVNTFGDFDAVPEELREEYVKAVYRNAKVLVYWKSTTVRDEIFKCKLLIKNYLRLGQLASNGTFEFPKHVEPLPLIRALILNLIAKVRNLEDAPIN